MPSKPTQPVVRKGAITPLRAEQRRLKLSQRAAKQTRKQQKRQIAAEVRRFTLASRKRRIITFAAIGSGLSLVMLLLATWFTPLLAIEKIEITGLQRLKEKSVMSAVANLKGTPLTLLDENSIAQRLQAFALIESFSVVSNPPHTLEIHIIERQPIAIVRVGETDYLYDPAGVQIGVAKAGDEYPRVDVNADPANNDKYRAAIEVMLAMPVELMGEIASVKASSQNNVQLTLRGSQSRSVIWGDSSQSVLKSKVLAALIKTTKKNRSVTFDVSSPTAPTVRYFNF